MLLLNANCIPIPWFPLYSKDLVVQFVPGGLDTKTKESVRKIFCGRTVKFSVWLEDIYTRQNGFIEFHQKAVRVNMPGGELSRMLVLEV